MASLSLFAVTAALLVLGSEGCGVSSVFQGRVIAGENARPHSWPWQILMLKRNVENCGGTLISPTWVVTAAHCIYGDEGFPSQFTVRVGEHDTRIPEGSEQNIPVSQVIRHPNYNPKSLDFDIALLRLSRPVAFNKFVQPACLASSEPTPGTHCFITGWGKVRHPGNMHNVLQQGRMPVVDRRTCHMKNIQSIGIPVTDRMICSGFGQQSRISGCHGDSGGPFVCQVNGRWELHGAVSHGSGDCTAHSSYTVYANVFYFRSWIQANAR